MVIQWNAPCKQSLFIWYIQVCKKEMKDALPVGRINWSIFFSHSLIRKTPIQQTHLSKVQKRGNKCFLVHYDTNLSNIDIDSSHLIRAGCELMQHKSWSSLCDVIYHSFGSTAPWNYCTSCMVIGTNCWLPSMCLYVYIKLVSIRSTLATKNCKLKIHQDELTG